MITINGTIIPEDCTVLEGITYLHIFFKGLSNSTKEFLKGVQDESVYVSYNEGDELYEYQNARIIYLGNNTIYVSSWIN